MIERAQVPSVARLSMGSLKRGRCHTSQASRTSCVRVRSSPSSSSCDSGGGGIIPRVFKGHEGTEWVDSIGTHLARHSFTGHSEQCLTDMGRETVLAQLLKSKRLSSVETRSDTSNGAITHEPLSLSINTRRTKSSME